MCPYSWSFELFTLGFQQIPSESGMLEIFACTSSCCGGDYIFPPLSEVAGVRAFGWRLGLFHGHMEVHCGRLVSWHLQSFSKISYSG
jgi:hypothetical protein